MARVHFSSIHKILIALNIQIGAIIIFSTLQLDTIADALVEKGYSVVDIKDALVGTLSEHILDVDNFTQALIGRNGLKQLNQGVRSDETLWLQADNRVDKLYFDAMKLLQEGMNKRLFMGLKSHEAHYAHYLRGTFYQKHKDTFVGKGSRKLTTVFYLNKIWNRSDGGDLLLYDEEDKLLENITPELGRLVIFLSERFPHEVLTALKSRYSIAGWFRTD